MAHLFKVYSGFSIPALEPSGGERLSLSSLWPSDPPSGPLMLFRRRRRAMTAAPAPVPPDAAKPASGAERQLAAIASLSSALARARDEQAVGLTLLEECVSLLGLDFAAVALISDDGKHASGLVALASNGDTDWWQEVALDFEQEPSGIASAAFEGGPVVVYDVAGSPQVNRRLAEKVGAKSAVFVPLVTDEKVPAVLVIATTREPRIFTGDELALLQALAAEAALALDRSSLGERARGSARARAARGVDRAQGALRGRPRGRAPGRRRGDRPGRRHALLPPAGRAGRADADSRRVGRGGLRPDRGRGRSASGLEPRGPRAAHGGGRRCPRGAGSRGSEARRDSGAARPRRARRARDTDARLRPDDRRLRAPPTRSASVAGGRGLAGRGCFP